jgi:MazG family protein
MKSFLALVEVIQTLRGEDGCPWDRKQTAQSMANYLVEEIFELVEAIREGDADAVCEELGDVLFQWLFITLLYQEQGTFDMERVISKITAKMIRRHPHVFDETKLEDVEAIRRNWQEIKRQEKAAQGEKSLLDSVPGSLPALMQSYRLSERVAGIGFDWKRLADVIEQVENEWQEFKDELSNEGREREEGASPKHNRQAAEFGDVLFTLVNVARKARIHPETALADTNHKFKKRFRQMEQDAPQGKMHDLSYDELNHLWQQAKGKVG